MRAAGTLSQRRHGALIVLERETNLGDMIEAGVTVDAALSKELLLSIFQPSSPMHDGAVVIQEGRVSTAGCILPLTVRTDLPEGLGTRHRAAVGITEETDALVIVVSEETSNISVVLGGEMLRGLDAPRLRVVLREVLGRGAQGIARGGGRFGTGRDRRRARSRAGPRPLGGGHATTRYETGDGRPMASRFQNLRPGMLVLALAISVFIWGVAQGDLERPAVLRRRGRARRRRGEPRRHRAERRLDQRPPARQPGGAAQPLGRAVEVPGRRPGRKARGRGLRGRRGVDPPPDRDELRGLLRRRSSRCDSRNGATRPSRCEPKRRAPRRRASTWPGSCVVPDKIRLEGARRQVLRMKEVVTEKIDIAGLTADAEREARLVLGGGPVWPEDDAPIRVLIRIEPDPGTEAGGEAAEGRIETMTAPVRKLFGTDGIRGTANVHPMTPEIALALGPRDRPRLPPARGRAQADPDRQGHAPLGLHVRGRARGGHLLDGRERDPGRARADAGPGVPDPRHALQRRRHDHRQPQSLPGQRHQVLRRRRLQAPRRRGGADRGADRDGRGRALPRRPPTRSARPTASTTPAAAMSCT